MMPTMSPLPTSLYVVYDPDIVYDADLSTMPSIYILSMGLCVDVAYDVQMSTMPILLVLLYTLLLRGVT